MKTEAVKLQMTNESIQRGSGKTWAEWREVLDAWGAAEKPHDEIARFVTEMGVDGWWAQGVTVGYERLIGRREIGQRPDGTFSTNVSKTVPVAISALFAAWVDETRRDEWLASGILTLRTARLDSSSRFDDNEFGGIVAVDFTAKSEAKASVSIEIQKLPDADAIPERKAIWKARLNDLAAHLKN